ncbi:hypothetical protein B0H13DRAFT_2063949 [Mycena leptocephala]|nr:hypothetical protein B0H13DRAFT_2063949 [Mycena leptocephala]
MDFLRILFGLFLLFLPVRPCSAELQRSADNPRRSPTFASSDFIETVLYSRILDILDVTSIAGKPVSAFHIIPHSVGLPPLDHSVSSMDARIDV